MNGGGAYVWTIGLAFVTAAAAMTALGALGEAWFQRRRLRRLRLRIEREPASGPTAGVVRTEAVHAPVWLERRVARMPGARRLATRLEQGDAGWGPGLHLVLTAGLGLVAGLLARVMTGSLAVALGFALLGLLLPQIWLGRRRAERRRSFERELPEAVDLVGRAIRAGHALSNALGMAAEEMPGPLGGEFRRVFEEQKFGLPLDEALRGLAQRVDLPDIRIFVTGVLVQREVGGNLAEILDNLSRTIRDRFTIRRQVRVHTAQGRFTGFLLTVLPVAVGVLIWLIMPEYIGILFRHDVGRLALLAAVLLQAFGFAVIRRIVDVQI